MGLQGLDDSDERFSRYVEKLAEVIGHADRVNPLRDYCTGLMLPCERKSVEPMAAVTAPGRTAAQHQALLHFVGQASWSDEKVLAQVCETVLPAMERHGPIEAWIIDDTGYPKKGKHSVGVARQYCGQLGKQDNCQAAVSLSIANRQASLPVRYRLYLPQQWAGDAARRRRAHVPEQIVFETKPEIALEQLRWACAAGLPRGVVLLDAGYGNHQPAHADQRPWAELCRRHSVEHLGVGARHQAVAAQAMVWSRTAADPAAAQRQAQAGLGQAAGVRLAQAGLAHDRLARGQCRPAFVALRPGARARRSRRQAADRRVALDRVAQRREGADQILALDTAPGHRLRTPGRSGQAALAHRARLPGAQAGARPWTLRRSRLAGLPPPRHAVHRSLRIPDLRARDDSPLGAACRR